MTKSVYERPKIVVGVSGSIGAYKAAELVRLLVERDYRVQVVMTRSAREFIRPLTFAALTREKVITDLFPEKGQEADLANAIEHIDVAQEADLLLIAPATADIIAKLAAGIADDFLTTTYLAYTGAVLIAPAMNTNMLHHSATQKNLNTLHERGVEMVDPETGELACGMVGPGRLADTEKIARAVDEILGKRNDLAGETLLITAGPTQESIDPVRYLSNRSSGRMGFALATEALTRGARVMIVTGPVAIRPPANCEVQSVITTDEMHRAVLERLPEASMIILAAAVADYMPVSSSQSKMKKGVNLRTLDLKPTVDILNEIGHIKGDRILVGFAAETENLVENAEVKLQQKNCDFVIANPVGEPAKGAGIDSDENQGVLLTATGEQITLPRAKKSIVARQIFDELLQRRPVRLTQEN
ncbi:MAG: bifunctional phosphopantothenoylcysteine decarboxylase/phosphopantothenate--cysteine ligase CoaBC [Solibacterales bacterium]|nr:bifunctional phosphopantothenoylcysteine decarboxylase/phosphopantothenate--cysteine ligase CoaBC [Bryobacterales bacterium]|tara:strand:- start:142638 stop:143885 length:1248 start_codon:yes stop_codon:yes gene_type:complete